MITYELKTSENLNIVDIKYIITEHPNPSHYLSKIVKKAEKVGPDSSSYNDKK